MKKYFVFLLLVSVIACNNESSNEPAFESFSKPKENPVLKADSTLTFHCPMKDTIVRWQRADVFNPAAIVKDGKICVLYRCEDNPAAAIGGRTSRIGLATSTDGVNFTKYPTPVLYPDNDKLKEFDHPGGCEDPRIVETEDGTYVLVYTSWNYKIARLTIAFSKDLIHWDKQGLAFAKAYNGKFANDWSKSGSIVTEMKNGKQIAAKLKGKYWMYWGERFVNLAWSENLIDWTPLVDDKGNLKQLIAPRNQKFDSDLTECGPPALITEKGIMLLYNGKNAANEKTDPNLPKNVYTVGKVIFDISDPEKVVYRADSCILKPTLPHEITGQFSAGTTFSEGMVYFNSKWYLYYGTADSFVGVAVLEK